MKKSMEKFSKEKKILIVKTEHIGDFVLTIPSIRTIKNNFPQAKISVVIGPWNRELAKSIPEIDKIILFKDDLIERNISLARIFFVFLFKKKKYHKLFKKINREKYDLMLNFSNRKISYFFNNKIKAKKKICGTKYSFKEINERDRMLRILELEGLKINKEKKNILKISKKSKQKIKNFLGNFQKKYFVVHPITPLNKKNWPLEKWSKLIKKVSKLVIFIGSKRDQKKINILIKKKNLSNVINLAGKISLPETTYLISKAEKFLGSDSGPMHLASLTETPVACLFGETNEKIWGPTGKKDKIIKRNKIENISVKEVLNLLK
jgi:ADP-heptose:LPS heptosyltransferase